MSELSLGGTYYYQVTCGEGRRFKDKGILYGKYQVSAMGTKYIKGLCIRALDKEYIKYARL